MAAFSADFSKPFADDVATAGAEMNGVPAGFDAEAADAHAGERGEQDTPHPGSRPHLLVDPGHAYVQAFGASDFYWVARIASIRGVFPIIYHLIRSFLLTGGLFHFGFEFLNRHIFGGLFEGRFYIVQFQAFVGIVDGWKYHRSFVTSYPYAKIIV